MLAALLRDLTFLQLLRLLARAPECECQLLWFALASDVLRVPEVIQPYVRERPLSRLRALLECFKAPSAIDYMRRQQAELEHSWGDVGAVLRRGLVAGEHDPRIFHGLGVDFLLEELRYFNLLDHSIHIRFLLLLESLLRDAICRQCVYRCLTGLHELWDSLQGESPRR